MLSLIAAGLLAAAGGQVAVSTTEVADLRCFAAFSVKISELGAAQPDRARDLQSGVLYFAGKLFGRNPRIDLVKVLPDSFVGFDKPEAVNTELLHCADELQAIGERLDTAGKALEGK